MTLRVPGRGQKHKVLSLALENAKASASLEVKGGEAEQEILEELRLLLDLSAVPRRIECYDISNIRGVHVVGSRVVFVDGHY